MRLPIILAGVVISLIALVGCRSKDRFEFTPTSPVVEWSDLAPDHVARPGEGFEVVVADKTIGVFPTSIAVARLAATPGVNDGSSRVELHMKPEVDFLSWNSVFDDFRSVSEVFPLNVMALDGADVTLHNLVSASHDLEAGLLLVYTEIHSTPHDSELRGAVYQIPSGQVLALIRSNVHVANPLADDERDKRESPDDEMELRDPRLASIKSFEDSTRACMLSLMAADQPTDVVAPEGWIPDRPFEPLEWPPVEDRYRRR